MKDNIEQRNRSKYNIHNISNRRQEYINRGKSKYINIIRNDTSEGLENIYDDDIDVIQRKRRSYYDYKNNLKLRKNEYNSINIPEYDYETQYVISTEKQFDNRNMNTYDRQNMTNNKINDNEYNRKYYIKYNREEYNDYRSYDSHNSSIIYYNNNKRTKYSEESIENFKSRDKHIINNNNVNSDDIDHFSWYIGQYLTPRYRIQGVIGEGTFGRVFECDDLKRKRKVAIKVVRNVQRYTEAAKIEAEILRDINMEDEFGEYSFCVMLYNAFLFNNSNMCLVFEKLGPSLYDFLGGNCSRGFLLADIQNIAEQLLLALSFLRKMRLTHTDLKLENILLTDNNYVWVNAPRHPGSLIRRPVRPEIRLIDFGSATYDNDYHGSIINTRQYRAPEVILDLGWDMSSDMWGVGCILMELYTGVLLFRTHEHLEHLAMIEKIIGPFPEFMLRKAYNSKLGRKYVNKMRIFKDDSINKKNINRDSSNMTDIHINHYNDRNNYKDEYQHRLNWPEGSSSTGSIKRVNECRPLEGIVYKKHILLAKFVRYILNVDPNSRPTPEMALRHEFFRYKFEEEI